MNAGARIALGLASLLVGPGALTRSERARPYRPRTDEQKKAEAVAFRAWLDRPMSDTEIAVHRAELGTARPGSPHRAYRRPDQRDARKVRAARKRRRGWA